MAADMEQLELRLVTIAAKDPIWFDTFKKGADLHKTNAATFFGKKYDQIGDFERTFAKTLTYMFLYGGYPEIAAINMRKVRDPKTGNRPYAKFTTEQAEKLRKRLLDDHPCLPAWWKKQEEKFRARRFLASRLLGRKRYFKDSSGDAIDEKSKNDIYNYEIQSLGGDLMGGSYAAGKLLNTIPPGLFGPGPIHHGHDSLMIEVEARYAARAKERIVEAMTTELDGLPLPAKAKSGERWSDLG